MLQGSRKHVLSVNSAVWAELNNIVPEDDPRDIGLTAEEINEAAASIFQLTDAASERTSGGRLEYNPSDELLSAVTDITYSSALQRRMTLPSAVVDMGIRVASDPEVQVAVISALRNAAPGARNASTTSRLPPLCLEWGGGGNQQAFRQSLGIGLNGHASRRWTRRDGAETSIERELDNRDEGVPLEFPLEATRPSAEWSAEWIDLVNRVAGGWTPSDISSGDIPTNLLDETHCFGEFTQDVWTTELEKELEQYKCDICHDIMVDPTMIFQCGHDYCGGCLEKWLEEQSFCPYCHQEVHCTTKSIRTARNIEEKVEAYQKKHSLPEGICEGLDSWRSRKKDREAVLKERSEVFSAEVNSSIHRRHHHHHHHHHHVLGHNRGGSHNGGAHITNHNSIHHHQRHDPTSHHHHAVPQQQQQSQQQRLPYQLPHHRGQMQQQEALRRRREQRHQVTLYKLVVGIAATVIVAAWLRRGGLFR